MAAHGGNQASVAGCHANPGRERMSRYAMNQEKLRIAVVAAGTLLLTLAAIGPARAVDSAAVPPAPAVGEVAPFDAAQFASAPFASLPLVPAPFAPAPAEAEPLLDVSALSPGEFVWQPERAPSGEVEIVVSIPLQRAYVYRGGVLIGVTTVSTGRPGHETPVGSFSILQKRREHYSNIYDNAPMPFMQRLTWGGIALHAGQIPGRPASHGCVRLPLAFARLLFGVTRMGGAVHVLDTSPPAGEALALVHGVGTLTGMGGPEEPVAGAAN